MRYGTTSATSLILRFFPKHAFVCAIALAVAFTPMWVGCSNASATLRDFTRLAQESAPIGHRQPNASDVPANVLRDEDAMKRESDALDRELNICRGC